MAVSLFLLIMALTIGSINVRSIVAKDRRVAVFDEVSKYNLDVVCLQECGITSDPSAEWSWGPSVWAPACVSRSEGVGVVVNNANVKIVSHEIIIPGRLQIVTLDFLGTGVRVMNVYAPAEKKERVKFLEILKIHLPGRMPTVLVGDFNCVRRREDRRGASGDGGLDVTSRILNEIVEDFSMHDVAGYPFGFF